MQQLLKISGQPGASLCVWAPSTENVQIKETRSPPVTTSTTNGFTPLFCWRHVMHISLYDGGRGGLQSWKWWLCVQNSVSGSKLLDGTLPVSPPTTLRGTDVINLHAFVGDPAFPLHPNLMHPYPDNYYYQNYVNATMSVCEGQREWGSMCDRQMDIITWMLFYCLCKWLSNDVIHTAYNPVTSFFCNQLLLVKFYKCKLQTLMVKILTPKKQTSSTLSDFYMVTKSQKGEK